MAADKLSDEVLREGIKALKEIYKKSKKKEDLQTMMAVADRFLLLFESTSDIERDKRHPTGFSRIVMETEDDGD